MKKNMLETFIVRNVQKEVKTKLRIISLEKDIRMGEALKLVVESYLESRKGK